MTAPTSSAPGSVAARVLYDALFTAALVGVDDDAAIQAVGERIEALEIALQRGRDLRAVLLARRWHAGGTYEAMGERHGWSPSRVEQLVKRGCEIARLPRKRRGAQK